MDDAKPPAGHSCPLARWVLRLPARDRKLYCAEEYEGASGAAFQRPA
jgi:hypothetical protein